jgi:hypothetical protein
MDKNGASCQLGRGHNCNNTAVGEALALPAWYSKEKIMMDGCYECIEDANWASPRMQNLAKAKKPTLVRFR